MLTVSLPHRPWLAALLLLGLGLPLAPRPAGADPVERPAGFVLLLERVDHEGPLAVGVYGIRPDPAEEGMWRVQVWEERKDRVLVSTDKVRCSTRSPMRITGTARNLILRELNPGGPITRHNRLDHLIWWAACAPEQAGKDPATLTAVARRMGFDGQLPERIQVLPAPVPLPSR